MQLGELLNKLATAANIDPANDQLKLILSSSSLATAEIDNGLANNLLSGLTLTMDSARNNEALRNHFYALFNNGGDAHLNRLLDEYGLDEVTASEIKAAPKTFQKWETLTKKIKDLTEQKASAKGGDKKALEDEIAKLNNQQKALKEEYEAKVKETDQRWVSKLRDIEILKELGSRDFPKDREKSVYIDMAKLYMDRKIAEKKLKVNYDPDKNDISLFTESDMQYFENNTPVTFKGFVDSILAENKLIPTSGQPAQTPKTVVTPAASSKTSAYDAKVNELLAQIK